LLILGFNIAGDIGFQPFHKNHCSVKLLQILLNFRQIANHSEADEQIPETSIE
jgi:hypothetical protein